MDNFLAVSTIKYIGSSLNKKVSPKAASTEPIIISANHLFIFKPGTSQMASFGILTFLLKIFIPAKSDLRRGYN